MTATMNVFEYFENIEATEGIAAREHAESVLLEIMTIDEQNHRENPAEVDPFYPKWLAARGVADDQFVSTWYLTQIL